VINVGDKILVLIKGPHGIGIVQAVVEHVYTSGGLSAGCGEHGCFGFRDDDENIYWCRGDDLNSPAANALIVAGTLR
jgi:hypothetical protein